MNPTHRHASLQGIGFAVLATACFATLGTTTRHVSAGLSLLVAFCDGLGNWFTVRENRIAAQPPKS